MSFDGRPADEDELRRAAHVIRHRGPDDEGFAIYGPVGFGFRRLAILDLSPAGHQPMETPDGRLSIVFNGEIYNYVELRRELEALGHAFRSTSDTEVLLHSYTQWGASCVDRFNGMWAFVIYDRQARKLFASRDRFGVKPLYRYRAESRLILASEIKAILAVTGKPIETNWQTAARFLVRRGLDEGSDTFYRGIDQLPAGSVFQVDLDGTCHERRFWNLSDVDGPVPDDPVAEFRTLFTDAVRLRMRSDVPVGVCLSGGIDSNAIISMMAQLRPPGASGRLQAFSYIPEEFSEAQYIEESIRRTNAELNELRITPERLWDVLPRALWHYDEPVHSPTALIGFELMRLARSKGVTVVLNGQGADEVNAGYHTYFMLYWVDLISKGKHAQARQEVAAYASAHGQGYAKLLRQVTSHWLFTRLERLPGYLALAQHRRMARLQNNPWYSLDFVSMLPVDDVGTPTPTTSEALRQSVETRPLPLYLRVEDRNSMAHSVEARLPFLDYRLVTLAFSLPSSWKLKGPWNKFIVREATRGVIAEPVRARLDKMGFPTPSRDWVAHEWYEPLSDLLSSRPLREVGFCQVDRVMADLDRHRRGEHDVSGPLFQLAEFASWLSLSRQGPVVATDPNVSPLVPPSEIVGTER